MSAVPSPPPMSYVPTPNELPFYEYLFTMVADKGGSGVVIGSDAVPLFTTSKLPVPVLKQLWVMADARKTNSLNKAEFFVLVRLIQLFQNQERPLPNNGDLRLVVSGKTPDQLNPPYFEGFTTNNQQQHPSMPPVSPQLATVMTPVEQQHNFTDGTAVSNASSTQLTLHNSDPYTMTPQDKARFDTIFPDYASADGYLYGREAVALFSKSGLDPSQLRQIWAMVDTQPVDNRLDALEFALAMHLIVCVSKKFLPLPETLPPNLLQWKQSSSSPHHSVHETPQNNLSTYSPSERRLSTTQSQSSRTYPLQQKDQVPAAAHSPAVTTNTGLMQQQPIPTMIASPPSYPTHEHDQLPPMMQQQQQPTVMQSPQPHSYTTQTNASSAQGFSAPPQYQQHHHSVLQSPKALSHSLQTLQQQQPLPPTTARMSISDAFSDLDTVVSGGIGLNNTVGTKSSTLPPPGASKEELQEHANKVAAAYAGASGASVVTSDKKTQEDIAPPSEIQFASPPRVNQIPVPTLTSSFGLNLHSIGVGNTSLPPQSQAPGNALTSADQDLVKLQSILQQLRAENVSLKAQLSSFSEEERAVRLHIHSTLEEITSLQTELSSAREAVSKAKLSLTDAQYELKSLQEKKAILTDWLDAEQDMLKNLTDVQVALKEKKSTVIDPQEDLLLNSAVYTTEPQPTGMGFYGAEVTSVGIAGFGVSTDVNGVDGESTSVRMGGFAGNVAPPDAASYGGEVTSKSGINSEINSRPVSVTNAHDESNLYSADVDDKQQNFGTAPSYHSYDLSSMPSGPQDMPSSHAVNTNSSWQFELMGGLPSAEHTVPPILNLGQVKSTDSFSVTTDTASLADLTAKISKLKAEVQTSMEISEAAEEEQFHLGKRAEELKKAALKAQQEAQELTESLNKKKGVFGGKDKKKQVRFFRSLR